MSLLWNVRQLEREIFHVLLFNIQHFTNITIHVLYMTHDNRGMQHKDHAKIGSQI